MHSLGSRLDQRLGRLGVSKAQANFMYTLGGLALGQAFTAVLYLLTARSSGPKAFGETASALALGVTLAGLLDFGSNSLMVRQMAIGSDAVPDFAIRASTKLVMAIALLGTWMLGNVALGALGEALTYAFPIVTLTTTAAQMSLTPLTARSEFLRVTSATVADKVLAVTVGAVLLGAGFPGGTALWVAVASGQTTSVIVAAAVWPAEVRTAVRAAVRQLFRGRPANPWRGSLHFGLGSLVMNAASLDVPIASVAAGPHAAGLVAAVNKWIQPMGLVSTAFSRSSYPGMAQAKDVPSAWRVLKAGRRLLWAMLGVVVGIVIFAQNVVDFLLGPQFAGSADVLRWLAIGIVPAALNQPLLYLLQARHRERRGSLALAVGISTQLILCYLLARSLGAVGAAVGFALGQLVMLCALGLFARRAMAGDSRPGSMATAPPDRDEV